MFDIEAAQERLPATVAIGSGGGVDLGSPPRRLRATTNGHPVEGQPDHGPGDDRQRLVVAVPRGAAGQTRVQPVPRLGWRLAGEAGLGDRDRVLGTPDGRVAEDELAAVLGRSPRCG
ncbi:hypothetical protein [Actinoplanes regularis]|uniref:hypothetical protein n=1 Tax=Actinoplanes regularis TaxID=52697 RepID=UPI001944E059|nr:hypothetical protein [Actinoplanes regularis]